MLNSIKTLKRYFKVTLNVFFLILITKSKIILHINEIFFRYYKKNLTKNIFKVALQYLFNIFLLFNTVSYIKLKVEPKMCIFKTWKNLEKISGNPYDK